jgi:hypothetical protein
MNSKLDTKKLVAHFGGRSCCHSMLAQAGYSVSKKAIEKWQERGSIPLNRLLQLAEVEQKFNNRTLNFMDFASASNE